MGRTLKQATPIKHKATSQVARMQVWLWMGVLLACISLFVLTQFDDALFEWQLPHSNLRVRLETTLSMEQENEVTQSLKQLAREGFMMADVGQVKRQVESLPWVRSASVRKEWPDIIAVDLEQQKAVAIWNNQVLLNAFGELFDGDLKKHRLLPVIMGPEGLEQKLLLEFAQISAQLKQQGLVLASLILTERRAWTLKLSDGMVMQIGREDVEERIKKFLEALKNIEVPQDRYIAYADLRYDTGFAVKFEQFHKTKNGNESGTND